MAASSIHKNIFRIFSYHKAFGGKAAKCVNAKKPTMRSKGNLSKIKIKLVFFFLHQSTLRDIPLSDMCSISPQVKSVLSPKTWHQKRKSKLLIFINTH